jgi:outer membrane protein assembly factor BamD (BamD/ComL family)
MYIRNLLSVVCLLVLLIGCSTNSTITIDPDLSDAELVQKGQEAFDRNRYTQALQYYEAVLERAEQYSEMFFTAEYEIAFVYYKMKQYDTAKAKFTELLSQYDSPDEELYPAQYKKLSVIVLSGIEEIQKN